MFTFFKRSRPPHPTIRQTLVQAGVPDAGDPTRVAVLEQHGQYCGRPVNFFRAVDPARQDRLLGSGHVEHEGTVVLNSWPEAEGAAPTRAPANRADHSDDERLVFWDAALARSSETTLSAPAATWLRARSTSDRQP